VDSLEKYLTGQPLKQPEEPHEKHVFSVQVREGALGKAWVAHRV